MDTRGWCMALALAKRLNFMVRKSQRYMRCKEREMERRAEVGNVLSVWGMREYQRQGESRPRYRPLIWPLLVIKVKAPA